MIIKKDYFGLLKELYILTSKRVLFKYIWLKSNLTFGKLSTLLKKLTLLLFLLKISKYLSRRH